MLFYGITYILPTFMLQKQHFPAKAIRYQKHLDNYLYLRIEAEKL